MSVSEIQTLAQRFADAFDNRDKALTIHGRTTAAEEKSIRDVVDSLLVERG